MVVVSDTTPIISLMKAHRLDLLERLFGEVLVPDGVFMELTWNSAFQEEVEAIRTCPFIKRVSIPSNDALTMLRRASGLDLGESEAIYYADTHAVDLLLMDEVKGRQVAKSLGLRITGTVGMILSAYKEAFLTKEEVLRIVSVLQKSGRHISDNLYRIILDAVEQ